MKSSNIAFCNLTTDALEKSMVMASLLRYVHTLCLAGLLLNPPLAGAQDPQGNPAPAVPSPTAASLGQYGEVPIGYYTGIPSVTVPLTTVRAQGVSLPVGISYHAQGHKVSALAGPVGMGWSFNAGGAVVRVLNGLPDERNSNQGGGFLDPTIKARMIRSTTETSAMERTQTGGTTSMRTTAMARTTGRRCVMRAMPPQASSTPGQTSSSSTASFTAPAPGTTTFAVEPGGALQG